MTNTTKKAAITVLGIDLAKSSFQLHGVDQSSNALCRKTFGRQKLKEYMANLPVCMVAMEACGSANH
jgi:transposase